MTKEERLAALYKLKELKAQKAAQEEPDAPLDAYQERKSMGMLAGPISDTLNDPFLKGLGDPVVALAQRAAHLTGVGADTMDRVAQNRRLRTDEVVARENAVKSMIGRPFIPQPDENVGRMMSPVNVLAMQYGGVNPVRTGAGLGALNSLLTPVENGGKNYNDDAISQTLINTAIGAAVPFAASVGRWVGGHAKNAVNLFSKEGPRNLADQLTGKELGPRQDLGNLAARLNRDNVIVPGSAPTSAQVFAGKGPGTVFTALEDKIGKEGGGISEQFNNRFNQQAAARGASLENLSKQIGDIPSLVVAREEATRPLMNQFESSKQFVDPLPIKSMINNIIAKSPAEDAIVKPMEDILLKLEAIAPDEGPIRAISVVRHINTMINARDAANKPLYDIKPLVQVKNALNKAISDVEPAYGNFLKTWRDQSVPINAVNTTNFFKGKLTNAIGENTPGRFVNTLDQAQKAIKQSAGAKAGKTLEDVYTPEQMKTLFRVRADIQRAAATNNPAQKTNIGPVTEIIPGIHSVVPNMMSRPISIMNAATKFFGHDIEPKIAKELANNLLNPPEMAKSLMRIKNAKGEKLAADEAAKLANQLYTMFGSNVAGRAGN